MQTWHDVGIYLPFGASGEIRLPCPQCSPGRKKHAEPCLAVNVDTGMWYCHHCGWKGCLRQAMQPQHASSPLGPRPPSPQDAQRKRAALIRVWQQARPITPQDPVGRYLQRRRVWFEPLPTVLRYHPYLSYRHEDGHDTHHPAMVARVQNPQGTGVCIHRTYLTSDGFKAAVPSPKKLMPTPTTTRGSAIRLDRPGETLAVTEGIETALAVRLSAGLPVWAAINTRGMKTLIVPVSVRLVVIAADNDTSDTGEDAAKQLARRLLEEGRRVKIVMPSSPDTDWADGMEDVHAR